MTSPLTWGLTWSSWLHKFELRAEVNFLTFNEFSCCSRLSFFISNIFLKKKFKIPKKKDRPLPIWQRDSGHRLRRKESPIKSNIENFESPLRPSPMASGSGIGNNNNDRNGRNDNDNNAEINQRARNENEERWWL